MWRRIDEEEDKKIKHMDGERINSTKVGMRVMRGL